MTVGAVELPEFSHSRIDVLGACGEKARLKLVVKVPEVPGVAAIAGKACHAYFQRFEENRLGVAAWSTTFAEEFDGELARAEEESGMSRSEFRVTGGKTKGNARGRDDRGLAGRSRPVAGGEVPAVRLGPLEGCHGAAA